MRTIIQIVVLLAFLYCLLVMLPAPLGGYALGMFVALFLLVIALPLFPGVTNLLTNDPNNPSWSCFTFLEPGRAKIIERGQRFKRVIMRRPGYSLQGELKDNDLKPNNPDYWKVVRTPLGEEDSHPIPLSLKKGELDLIWYWSRLIYDITGSIFTGFEPYQGVRRSKFKRQEKVPTEEGGYKFEIVDDYTDHYRVEDFQVFIKVVNAETSDQAPLSYDLGPIMRVVNAYEAAYESDDWLNQFLTELADGINRLTRALTREQIMSETGEFRAAYSRMEETLAEKAIDFGIDLRSMPLLDVEVTNPELRNALTKISEAQAKKRAAKHKAEARRIEGQGEADAQAAIAASAQKHGTAGMAVIAAQRDIQVAQAAAAKGSTIILNVGDKQGGSVDPKTAFLHQTLQGDNHD